MNKEKTIKEWLETLPDGYRERALRNYDPNYHDGLPINDLAYAVVWAFCWEYSPEMESFWYAVYNWALGRGELPQLPEEEMRAVDALSKALRKTETEKEQS